MSETQPSHGLPAEEDGGQPRAPHRVIGTSSITHEELERLRELI